MVTKRKVEGSMFARNQLRNKDSRLTSGDGGRKGKNNAPGTVVNHPSDRKLRVRRRNEDSKVLGEQNDLPRYNLTSNDFEEPSTERFDPERYMGTRKVICRRKKNPEPDQGVYREVRRRMARKNREQRDFTCGEN